MINTDKYEGHSVGKWRVRTRKGTFTVKDCLGDEVAAVNDYADAQLIADAPLILQALIDERAEVKRLRDELKFVIEMLEEKPSDMEWYECRNLITQQVVINLDD
tara:strand:+ start:223 stop:534 length:312 start_codon:yes stop_codon:yes gene_type:complete